MAGQAFDVDGSFLHSFGNINETSNGDQHSPSLVILEDGNADPYDNIVIFTWEGASTQTNPSDDQGVFYRAYEIGQTTAVSVNPFTLAPGGQDGEFFISPTAVAGEQSKATVASYDNGSKFKFGFEGVNAGDDGYHVVDQTRPVSSANINPMGADAGNCLLYTSPSPRDRG